MTDMGRRSIAVFYACLGLAMAGDAHAQDRAATLAVDGGAIAAPTAAASGVTSFRAIPYAAPPVGPLRWRPPAPVAAWQGVRDATAFSADCMQEPSDRTGLPRSEDCLYLNVWTAAAKGERRPVFVWIHGGGSRVGSGAQPQFDGTALALKGVVVVTINYRLGPFGFLSTPALSAESGYGASGNYGFMDQMAALGWVQRNIAAFGGDPRRVTVGGESSGSVSTSVLMASPMAAGLFHQAIGESGASFRVAAPGSMGATNLSVEEAKGDKLMATLGAADLARARAASAEAVLDGAKAMGVFFNLPVVDGRLLPASPRAMFESRRHNDMPLLAGWNADEGSMQIGPTGDLPELLTKFYGPAAADVAPFYAQATSNSVSLEIDAAGDHGIAYPTWKWGMAQQRFGKAPVYLYEFDRVPPVRKDAGPRQAGSFHGAEIVYVFDTLGSQPTWAATDDDRRIAGQMSSYWASFIKTGRPDGPGLPPWPRYDPADGPQRMRIGLKTGAEADPDYRKYLAIAAAHDRVDPADPRYDGPTKGR